MLIDSLNREAELEEVTDALLLSRSDDFNAIAALDLRGDLGHGHVYRIAPIPTSRTSCSHRPGPTSSDGKN